MPNFDKIIDRRRTNAVKYECLPEIYKDRKDLQALWVADMDFRTPKFIIRALKNRLEHPVLGYSVIPKDYFPTIASWVRHLHGWKVDPENIRFVPGIVKGIGFVLKTFLKPGDKVIIQTPVYHPFRIVPEKCGMEVVYNPLIPIYEDGAGLPENMCGKDKARVLKGYRMDLDALDEMIDENTKVLILSNPQNPSGVCWDADTLKRLADITAPRGVLVVSDEIHAEMAHDGYKHIPYASVSTEAAANSITFMAPTKTFNIAGVVTSYAIVPNPALRTKFFGFLESCELDSPPIFSTVATMAAYKKGARWRKKMLDYVEGNIDYVDSFLKENCPRIRCLKPQASFLVWLDCRQLGMAQEDLVRFFAEKVGVYMNDGSVFGVEGTGFMRLNVGCPRAVLEKIMCSLAQEVARLV